MASEAATRVAAAFDAASPAEQTALEELYRGWIAMRMQSLTNLGSKAKEEVLERLISRKIESVSMAAGARRERIAAVDRLDVLLSPIEQQSEIWSRSIAGGARLSPDERAVARQFMRQVEWISEKYRELPSRPEEAYLLRVSETMLDLNFALNEGNGATSLRLGKFRSIGRKPGQVS